MTTKEFSGVALFAAAAVVAYALIIWALVAPVGLRPATQKIHYAPAFLETQNPIIKDQSRVGK